MPSPGTSSKTRYKPRRAIYARLRAVRAALRARDVSLSPRSRATFKEAVITKRVLASMVSRMRPVSSAESRFSSSRRASCRARFVSMLLLMFAISFPFSFYYLTKGGGFSNSHAFSPISYDLMQRQRRFPTRPLPS